MESAVRTICEPIFGRPLREISFGTVLLRLFAALQRFDGQIQPQLILLQKTLLNVEGLGRQLYPDLDIWKTAAPVLRAWQRERVQPARRMARAAPGPARRARGDEGLADHRQGGHRTRQDSAGTRPLPPPAATAVPPSGPPPDNTRRDLLIASAALLPAGVLWLGLQIDPQWPGLLLAGAGVLVMAASIFRA